ncbi:MAG: beta-galactosidase, partial [Bacteroidales bacterium]|nr:beta-galactosidase [Bacteroidales bacterium]
MKNLLVTLVFAALTISAVAQENLKTDQEFPILAWVGVPEVETGVERFKELKESGININYSGYSSIEAVEKALDAARKAGVKLLPSCPELKAEPEKTAKRLMKHPALAGYHLQDEPGVGNFPELSEWVKRIQAVDKNHYCYINLLPNHAPKEALGFNSYREHLEAFVKQVPVSFISFDHYPIDGSGSLNPHYYYANLEEVSAVAEQRGIPFWAFALATAHNHYPVPTVGEIKVQMFSNLAYGAQTLQYFTYWNPGVNPYWDFHQAPIDFSGKRTVVYDRIKAVNREIHALAGVFLGAKKVSVWHTGKRMEGTMLMDKLPEHIHLLETGDNGAVVSLLEKGNNRFLVIVNRDYRNPMRLTVMTDEHVRRVLKDATT